VKEHYADAFFSPQFFKVKANSVAHNGSLLKSGRHRCLPFPLSRPLLGEDFQAPAHIASADPSSSRPARSKSSREARAKAKLEKIKPLINAGKYKTARRRLRKLNHNYPGTVAALEARIILGVLED
jgi:hypothetical protein